MVLSQALNWPVWPAAAARDWHSASAPARPPMFPVRRTLETNTSFVGPVGLDGWPVLPPSTPADPPSEIGVVVDAEPSRTRGAERSAGVA